MNTYLLSEFSAGRNAVVVIDEAQNLEPTVLEQLRMLSNLETARGKLLQIILVGQPELRAKLSLPGMRQLDQRIAVRFHINELSRGRRPDTSCTACRWPERMPASPSHGSALKLIYQYSGGLPRRINLLCDRALMNAFVHETHCASTAPSCGKACATWRADGKAVGARKPAHTACWDDWRWRA